MTLAGGSSLGVVNQAKESGLYAIGCTNESAIDTAPASVMGSCVESLDDTVYSMCKELQAGTIKCGERKLSISNGYFKLSYGNTSVAVPQKLKDQINNIVSKLTSGDLELPKSTEEVDAWVAKNSDLSYSK